MALSLKKTSGTSELVETLANLSIHHRSYFQPCKLYLFIYTFNIVTSGTRSLQKAVRQQELNCILPEVHMYFWFFWIVFWVVFSALCDSACVQTSPISSSFPREEGNRGLHAGYVIPCFQKLMYPMYSSRGFLLSVSQLNLGGAKNYPWSFLLSLALTTWPSWRLFSIKVTDITKETSWTRIVTQGSRGEEVGEAGGGVGLPYEREGMLNNILCVAQDFLDLQMILIAFLSLIGIDYQ